MARAQALTSLIRTEPEVSLRRPVSVQLPAARGRTIARRGGVVAVAALAIWAAVLSAPHPASPHANALGFVTVSDQQRFDRVHIETEPAPFPSPVSPPIGGFISDRVLR